MSQWGFIPLFWFDSTEESGNRKLKRFPRCNILCGHRKDLWEMSFFDVFYFLFLSPRMTQRVGGYPSVFFTLINSSLS